MRMAILKNLDVAPVFSRHSVQNDENDDDDCKKMDRRIIHLHLYTEGLVVDGGGGGGKAKG